MAGGLCVFRATTGIGAAVNIIAKRYGQAVVAILVHVALDGIDELIEWIQPTVNVAALSRFRLTASRLNWFAACFAAPCHCLPQVSGHGIVPCQMGRPKEGATSPIAAIDVRFGSKADTRSSRDVCFTPESGH